MRFIKFASNATANIFNGVVGAFYQLGLTALSFRILSDSDFSAWGLALSLATIVPLFGSNLANVVARRVIDIRHIGSSGLEIVAIKSARLLAKHLALLAVISVFVFGFWVYLNNPLININRYQFLILLGALILGNITLILLQVDFGLYFSDESYWPPAIITALMRLGAIIGFILVVGVFRSNIYLGGVGFLLGGFAGIFFAKLIIYTKKNNEIVFEYDANAFRKQYWENIKIFSGFIVWALGSLVIQYGIPPMVSLISPEKFNAFYIASTVNTVAIGGITAIIGALFAPVSKWHKTENFKPLKMMAIYSPLVCGVSCLIFFTIAWYSLNSVLMLLKGNSDLAENIYPLLALLGFQTIIRLSAMGHSVSLAAVGSSLQISGGVVLEILITLCVAIPLGWQLGANSLLLGLIFAGFICSLYTCAIGLSVSKTKFMASSSAYLILIGSQITVSILWWIVVHKVFQF